MQTNLKLTFKKHDLYVTTFTYLYIIMNNAPQVIIFSP